MKNLLVIMDMNNGFAKKGALYSPRSEALIQPIADFCFEARTMGWTILALTDTHCEHDAEMEAFPLHSLAGTEEPEIVDELKPYCDIILPKYTTGGFFEVQEAARENPALDLMQYESIHLVGCCTDLCIFNFALITQKYMEYQFHMGRLKRVPDIVVRMNLVDTYDGPGHDAKALNEFFPDHMELNGIKVTYE